MFPGVRATATIRPQVSARQWIFVVLPPRETPTACVHSPFSASSRTVGLHMGAIEHEFIWDRSGGGHLGEDALPHPPSRPACVTVVDRLCRPVLWRHVAPSPAVFRMCRMPLITRRSSTRRAPRLVLRQMWFQCCLGFVRQPEVIAHGLLHAPRPIREPNQPILTRV